MKGNYVKTQSNGFTDQIPEWIDQIPPARLIEPPAGAFEVNDPRHNERAARLGRLEHRQVYVMDQKNIDLARFRI